IDGEEVAARPPRLAERIFRRVRRNKVAAVALVALAASLLVPQLLPLFRHPQVVVAVADFHHQTGARGLAGLSGLPIPPLEQSRRLSVLPRSRMSDRARQAGHADAANIGEPLGREVARKAQAQALLLATLRRFDDLYVVDLKIL